MAPANCGCAGLHHGQCQVVQSFQGKLKIHIFAWSFLIFYMFASDFKSVDTTGFKQYTSNIYLVGLQTDNLQWLDTSSDKVMTFQLLFWILVTCMSACVCVCVCVFTFLKWKLIHSVYLLRPEFLREVCHRVWLLLDQGPLRLPKAYPFSRKLDWTNFHFRSCGHGKLCTWCI